MGPDANVEVLSNENEVLTIAENTIDTENITALQITQSISNTPEVHSSDNDNTNPRFSKEKNNIVRQKRKRKELLKASNKEEELRIERIKQIIIQEKELANLKLNHEESMAAMMEEHLKEFNNIQLKHLKEIQTLEIEINKRKLRAIQCQCANKENIKL